MKSGYMLSGQEAMSTSTDFFEEHSICSHIPPYKGLISRIFCRSGRARRMVMLPRLGGQNGDVPVIVKSNPVC